MVKLTRSRWSFKVLTSSLKARHGVRALDLERSTKGDSMSSSLNVYAVPLDRLRAVVGSRDQALLDAILAGKDGFLENIDDIDDEGEMRCRDALSQIINGDIADDGPGYLYGYALEAICAQISIELPNICPIARASRWIDEVDAALEQQNLAVRLCNLAFKGSPIAIPEPDDSPCIGWWSASEIAAALTTIQSLDWTSVPNDHADTFAQISEWLKVAANTPDASLIGFLS